MASSDLVKQQPNTALNRPACKQLTGFLCASRSSGWLPST